jgi:two-component system response regulator GlrR
MEEVRILLLDLTAESGLGRTLRGILESSTKPHVHLQEKFLTISESFILSDEFYESVFQFNPHLLFFVLPSNYLKLSSALIQSMGQKPFQLPIMVVLEGDKPDEMLEFLKLDVPDFMIPPLKPIDIITRLSFLLEQKPRGEPHVHTLKEKLGLKQLVGGSPAFLAAVERVPLVAKCEANVLISGETGTGKELFARAIHYLSPRAGNPFIPISCGAIPVELVENELFGHIQGAFTSAASSQPGLIYQAHGGTLFLDEIDCLPLASQVKLLRLLQEKEYRQLGSSKVLQADVRVIAATNIELEKAVSDGKFRQDLYYRLNILPLALPPLRERKEDIPLLAHHFLVKYAVEFDKKTREFTSDALQKLMAYGWPGNVRELENVVERAVAFSRQTVIQSVNIFLPGQEKITRQESFRATKSRVIAQFEKEYIQDLLRIHKGSVTKAAEAVQKNRRTFWELIRKHEIDVRRFRPGSR